MTDKPAQLRDVVDAILDLSRISIAFSERFTSKTEAARRLAALSIPASRVAAILAMPLRDVTSALSKARKADRSSRREDGQSTEPTEA